MTIILVCQELIISHVECVVHALMRSNPDSKTTRSHLQRQRKCWASSSKLRSRKQGQKYYTRCEGDKINTRCPSTREIWREVTFDALSSLRLSAVQEHFSINLPAGFNCGSRTPLQLFSKSISLNFSLSRTLKTCSCRTLWEFSRAFIAYQGTLNSCQRECVCVLCADFSLDQWE